MEIVNEVAPGASAEAVLAAAAWPGAKRSTIVIGHQPTLGMVAARLINGVVGYVSIKKGAIWWFETRERDGKCKTVLRAMATPESIL
jgi:phosphohistidine phosphatase